MSMFTRTYMHVYICGKFVLLVPAAAFRWSVMVEILVGDIVCCACTTRTVLLWKMPRALKSELMRRSVPYRPKLYPPSPTSPRWTQPPPCCFLSVESEGKQAQSILHGMLYGSEQQFMICPLLLQITANSIRVQVPNNHILPQIETYITTIRNQST